MAAAWIAAAASLFCVPAGAQQVTEQDVEAAFLYNFTRFVEWPAELPSAPEPFRVCIVAGPTMTAAVQRTMQGESVNGRAIATPSPTSAQEARRCQILFVGRAEMDRAASLLAAVRTLPVLTVSDGDRFIARGGVIQFVRDGGRVRFDVNVEAARRTGLSISSRLLQVARNVQGSPQ